MSQAECYDLLKKTNKFLSIKDICKLINVSKHSAQLNLQGLSRSGFVKRRVVCEGKKYSNGVVEYSLR